MKFHYAYHTKDNKREDGVVCAASRDAAYAILRQRGIKPTHVDLMPGLFNRIQSLGKRGIAIVILVIVAAVLVVALGKGRSKVAELEARSLCEDRGQIYGDPVALKEAQRSGWAVAFSDVGDRFLSAYAIPGAKVDDQAATPDVIALISAGVRHLVPVADDDPREVAQMKRIVNGMKFELAAYLAEGGTVEDYIRRLDIRQKAEAAIYERYVRELVREDDPRIWKEKNAKLRAMGLPMVERED